MFTRPLRTALFLLALMKPGATLAAPPPAPRVGQEWTYTGSIHITGAQRADHSYTTTATVVGPAEMARFRRAGNMPFLPAASLAWLTLGREAEAHIPEAAGIDPGIRLVDAVLLPVPFGTGRPPGEGWISRAPFLGLSPPFPQTLPLRHRVLGIERVGAHRCRRIERTVAAPLPLTAWMMRILSYRELFWVDASSGVLLRYHGSARFRNGPENEPATTVAASLEWKRVRALPAPSVRERREQARRLTEVVGLLFSRSGQPGEVRLQEARTRLALLRQSSPRSPYAPATEALGELVRILLGDIERGQELERQRSALVGKPAPMLALKDLDGKEHTLGEYRGKLILLNVFASW